jgi:hypothetical protein
MLSWMFLFFVYRLLYFFRILFKLLNLFVRLWFKKRIHYPRINCVCFYLLNQDGILDFLCVERLFFL